MTDKTESIRFAIKTWNSLKDSSTGNKIPCYRTTNYASDILSRRQNDTTGPAPTFRCRLLGSVELPNSGLNLPLVLSSLLPPLLLHPHPLQV